MIDKKGIPIHSDGITEVKGLYFLGFPWLIKRDSGTIHGVLKDAEFIAEKIVNGTSK